MVGMTVWAVAFGVAFTAALLLGGRPKAQTAAILLSVFLLGCAMAALAERRQSVSLPQGETAFEAIVADEPVERGRTLRFDAIACSGPLKGHWVRLTLLKDTAERRYATLGVGDGMLVRSRLVPPANYRESNFDYATYLQSRGIVATTFVYYRNWRKSAPRLSALTVVQRARISAMRLRHWLLGRYRSLGLEGQDFAVVAAMTLGDKSALSGSMREAYSLAGASHILALSGMHLGVIYLLLSMLLSGRRRRLLGECLLLMAIWSYVFIVGMPSSVVRSALMISVYGLVGLTGRSRMSVNALAFAAVVLLVANPLALFDIGFQLSFAAVAFILVFPVVRRLDSLRPLSPAHRLLRWAWQLSIMSLLAQIGTAPLVAFYFGRLPVCSLLTGLVVIPAATAIIYLAVALFAGVLCLCCSRPWPQCLPLWPRGSMLFCLPWRRSRGHRSVCRGLALCRWCCSTSLPYASAGCWPFAAGAWSRQESGGREMLLPTVAVGNSPIAAAVRRPGSCVPAHGLSVCAILRSFYRSLKLL